MVEKRNGSVKHANSVLVDATRTSGEPTETDALPQCPPITDWEPDQAAFFSASPLDAITSINSFHDFTNDFAPSSWRRAARMFTSTPA